MSCLVLVFDLGVRDGGKAVRTPVDYALAAVDKSLFIKTDKYLLYRL